jgi:hypothetical protein
MMNWKEYKAPMGEMRNAHRILIGNPRRKRRLGRPEKCVNVRIMGAEWI